MKRGDILNKTAGKPVQTKWRSSRDLGEGFGRPGDKWLRQKEWLAPDGWGAGCVSNSGRPGARLVQREQAGTRRNVRVYEVRFIRPRSPPRGLSMLF